MNRELEMRAKLRSVFAERQVNNCISYCVDEQFYISDDADNQPCKFISSPPGFEISNQNQKIIYLLAVDHCFFRSDEAKRCDCIVFDDTSFCFVELKLNVEEFKQVAQKAKDAREQLSQVILFMKHALGADSTFLAYRHEAYLVMQPHVYPKSKARLSQISREFLQTYGVEYFEVDKRIF